MATKKKMAVIKAIHDCIINHGNPSVKMDIPLKVTLADMDNLEIDSYVQFVEISHLGKDPILSLVVPFRKGVGYFDCFLNGEDCIDFDYSHDDDEVEYNSTIDDKVLPISFFKKILDCVTEKLK